MDDEDKSGTRTNGVNSGSRASNWNNYPWNSNWNNSLRAVCDGNFNSRWTVTALSAGHFFVVSFIILLRQTHYRVKVTSSNKY